MVLPAEVVRTARALGGASARWIDELPHLLEGLCRDWRIRLGATLHGGTSSYVAEATTADGEAAVLKVAIPDYEPLTGEIRTLELAEGRGYARLLAADLGRGAMLTERLGAPLDSKGASIERQIEILCETLLQAWRPAIEPVGLQTGVEKAAWHAGFASATWEAVGRPCPQGLIDQALAFAQNRGAAWSPQGSRLLHGDPHEANALADPRSPGAYRFVDPDGLFAEPAYDLAVVMRSWTDELLAGNALTMGREWCARLAARTGAPEDAIWEWAVIERVSTGLLLVKLDAAERGLAQLRVAQAWAAA